MIAFSTLLSAVVINMFKSKGHKVRVPKWLMGVSKKDELEDIFSLWDSSILNWTEKLKLKDYNQICDNFVQFSISQLALQYVHDYLQCQIGPVGP